MASPSPSPPPPLSSPPRALSPNGTQRHHPERIPENTLRNIDLGSVQPSAPSPPPSMPVGTGSSKGGKDLEAGGAAAAARRAPPAAAGGGRGEDDMEAAAAAASAADHQQQHQQRASSALALLLAQCRRFDVELSAVFLAGILVTTACAIFTRDEGWFVLEAPFRQLVGSAGATVVYHIGLSTYTAQAHSVSDPTLILYTHQGGLDEASPTAEKIAYALYAFLVLSLVSAAGILWYLALFCGYLKSPSEINRGREAAVRCLGLQAMGLGVALLALGTAAFRRAVAQAFVRQPFANGDGSPFNDVDTAGRRLHAEYAYHLTGLTWFLWLLVGGILLFRSCCWAKRAARRGDLEEEAEAAVAAGSGAAHV